MSFMNKVVIVTGGSSGIGASTAILFAKEGADVVIVGRNETKLNDVAAQISKVGKKPLIINADVAKDDENQTIVEKTIQEYGKIDVLVNNAGLSREATLDSPNLMDVYDLVINTNLRAVFKLTNQATPYLIQSKGNIVNISSVVALSTLGKFRPSGHASYCTSKAGLNHFSKYCAMELAPKGVRVNVVSPGPVVTSFLENAGMENSDWNSVKEMTALKVVAQPEEVADLIIYLASDKAKSITGSNYVLDCGYLADQ